MPHARRPLEAYELANLQAAMRTAIDMSHRARGLSTPNPPVGAVIMTPTGQLVGTGYTSVTGGAHAERNALDAAGPLAEGATAVITLEPCAHQGRTGPCTEALTAAGIAKVCYAVDDPNPIAAGGADELRAAGIEVIAGIGADQVSAGPLREWLFRQRTGRPHVTVKLAMTLDGKVAAPDLTSRWITGEEARDHSHRVREELDAIVVGTGTALADDPALTARTPSGTLTARQPRRLVIGHRPVPDDAAIRGPGGQFRQIFSHDPAEALAACPDALHIEVEGGPTMIGAFFAAGLVDRVQAYLAPRLLGAGRNAVEIPGIATLADAHDFTIESVINIGADLLITLS